MAEKVLILGHSGTGKSASLRNFKKDEITVINCAGKRLPFKNDFKQIIPTYKDLTEDIMDGIESAKTKAVVVDDAQYILSFPMMRRIHENGWDKWNDIQGDFFEIIQRCDDLSNDTIVYFLAHIERKDDGFEKIKTVGKMLDEKITIEGLFTTVLKTYVEDGKYFFITQNSGKDTVKSPIGMFDSYAIENDLKYVDSKIRNYYGIGEHVSDDEMKAMDKEAAKPEIEKPDADGRRRRGRPRKEEAVNESDNADGEDSKTDNVEAEAPKRRTRKARGEDPVIENIKSGDGISNEVSEANETIGVTKEEAPKRRRRRKTSDEPATMEELYDSVPF